MIRFKKIFKDGVLVEERPYEVSDEQLAEEAEERAMANVEDLIDAISNMSDAKLFLKRLCKRLNNKGYLP